MLAGVTRAARLSSCGRYRWTLSRVWDAELPLLLVVMFNPSTADASIDDPTIVMLCHIAAHNGFGGIGVVNGIPLRSSTPKRAAQMVGSLDSHVRFEERDAMQTNRAEIGTAVRSAGAVLLAWGALASQCPGWFDSLIEDIRAALIPGTPLYCLGKTAAGHPKHPMARGKHKVPKDAPLIAWSAQ